MSFRKRIRIVMNSFTFRAYQMDDPLQRKNFLTKQTPSNVTSKTHRGRFAQLNDDKHDAFKPIK